MADVKWHIGVVQMDCVLGEIDPNIEKIRHYASLGGDLGLDRGRALAAPSGMGDGPCTPCADRSPGPREAGVAVPEAVNARPAPPARSPFHL